MGIKTRLWVKLIGYKNFGCGDPEIRENSLFVLEFDEECKAILKCGWAKDTIYWAELWVCVISALGRQGVSFC